MFLLKKLFMQNLQFISILFVLNYNRKTSQNFLITVDCSWLLRTNHFVLEMKRELSQQSKI